MDGTYTHRAVGLPICLHEVTLEGSREVIALLESVDRDSIRHKLQGTIPAHDDNIHIEIDRLPLLNQSPLAISPPLPG